MGLKWSIKKIGNKYRVHRNDKRKSEIQGMSFFEPRGIMDVLDNHPKNILVYGQTKLTSTPAKSTGETMALRKNQKVTFNPKIAPCLRANHHNTEDIHYIKECRVKIKVIGNVGNGHEAQNVYDPTGIAPTVRENHGKITKVLLTKGANSMKEILPKSTQKKSQTTTCLSEDFHVRLSALLEKEGDLKIPEVHSFLKSQGLHRKNDHALYSLKMSKAYYLTTKGELSELSSPRWMKLGMTANGRCLTVRTSECHRTGKECSLSDKEKIIDKYLSFL